jgi:DNA repair exonuclease SbcCD ATPase subunit
MATIKARNLELESRTSSEHLANQHENMTIQLRELTDRNTELSSQLNTESEVVENDSTNRRIIELESEISESATLRTELENRLFEWSKWADEITGQLAERDATIAELSMNQEHFTQSLAEAEELRARVSELEQSASDRMKQLSDDSPLGRRFDEVIPTQSGGGEDSDISPRAVAARELEAARSQIEILETELNELKNVHPPTPKSRVVTSEEAEMLLEAYRAEIDRLAKENAQLRTTAAVSSGNRKTGGDSQSGKSSTSSWWNILETGSPRTAPAGAFSDSPRSDSPNSSRPSSRRY